MFHPFRATKSYRWLVFVGVLMAAIMGTCARADRSKIGFHLDDTDVPSAVFTPDGKYIVAGGFRRVSLLDIHAHTLIGRFPEEKRGPFGSRSCEVIALSPDGKYVAAASGWRDVMTVRIWDFATGRLVRSFDTGRTQVLALAFSTDGKRLAAGTAFRFYPGPKEYEGVFEIWLWDVDQKGDEPVRLRGHEAPVQGIVFLPDGKRMASVGNDDVIRIWDTAGGRQIKQSWAPKVFGAPFGYPAAGVRFGALQLGASAWLDEPRLSRISLTVSADGKHLVCGRSVWDAEKLSLDYFVDDGRLWKNFDEWERAHGRQPGPKALPASEVFGRIADNHFGALTPDGRRLVFSSSGKILVFDVDADRLILQDQVFSNGAWVATVAVSPDGRFALAGGSGATAGPGGEPVMRDPNQLYLYRLPPPQP